MAIAIVALASSTAAAAHVPIFPAGDGPFVVDRPAESKAYYLHLQTGATHVFVVPPVGRPIPVQVLVLDDDRGRSTEHAARVDCGLGWRSLRIVDTPFFEPFSRTEHRYRVVDAIGPSEDECRVEVVQVSGPPAPYTFSIGDEERFSLGDLIGLLTLGERLERWREGP
jgi:hypothetical protein